MTLRTARSRGGGGSCEGISVAGARWKATWKDLALMCTRISGGDDPLNKPCATPRTGSGRKETKRKTRYETTLKHGCLIWQEFVVLDSERLLVRRRAALLSPGRRRSVRQQVARVAAQKRRRVDLEDFEDHSRSQPEKWRSLSRAPSSAVRPIPHPANLLSSCPCTLRPRGGAHGPRAEPWPAPRTPVLAPATPRSVSSLNHALLLTLFRLNCFSQTRRATRSPSRQS